MSTTAGSLPSNSFPILRTCNDHAGAAQTIRNLAAHRGLGPRMVFTNGCFDVIHPGHLSVLRHCYDLAHGSGYVVVALNSDESCSRIKGPGRPILDQTARGTILSTLRYVDFVVTFDEDTPLELIGNLLPDIIVKGGDYDPLSVVGRCVSQVSIAPLDATWSTTRIIEKIKRET